MNNDIDSRQVFQGDVSHVFPYHRNDHRVRDEGAVSIEVEAIESDNLVALGFQSCYHDGPDVSIVPGNQNAFYHHPASLPSKGTCLRTQLSRDNSGETKKVRQPAAFPAFKSRSSSPMKIVFVRSKWCSRWA